MSVLIAVYVCMVVQTMDGGLNSHSFSSDFMTWSTYSIVLFCIPQHVFGHHLYTNIDSADPDIYTRPDVS
jgi:hypothetical protein